MIRFDCVETLLLIHVSVLKHLWHFVFGFIKYRQQDEFNLTRIKHALTVIMGFLGYLCYLCHKCTEKIGLVVDPSRTLPDKTGIGRVRLVVAMVTVQIALWVGKGVGGSGNAEVDEGQVGGALHGISVVVPDSAPVTRKKGNSIVRK